MAKRGKKRTLRPRLPARTKKKRAAKKAQGRQHRELIGLGIAAFAVFLGIVMYVGWNGGYVGMWIADGFEALIGDLAYALPVVLATIGGLLVGRSALLDVRPFRTGL